MLVIMQASQTFLNPKNDVENVLHYVDLDNLCVSWKLVQNLEFSSLKCKNILSRLLGKFNSKHDSDKQIQAIFFIRYFCMLTAAESQMSTFEVRDEKVRFCFVEL